MDDRTFIPPFLIRLLRIDPVDSIKLSAEAVEVGGVTIPHTEPGEWTPSDWIFWKRVTFTHKDAQRTRFHLSSAPAAEFMATAKAWRLRVNQAENIESSQKHLERWEAMMKEWRYIPRHEIEEWLVNADTLHRHQLAAYDQIQLVDTASPMLSFRALMRDPWGIAKARNDDFVQSELQRTAPWFNAFRVPPTMTQREVAIRDETNSLVVAGAGTGKTSTIATKIRYILEAKLAEASRLLVVAFNTDAAQEIRKRRSGCLLDAANTVSVAHGVEVS